jgi:endoglucanase
LKNKTSILLAPTLFMSSVALFVAGCRSNKTETTSGRATPAAAATQPAPLATPAGTVPPSAGRVVRIKAGSSTPFTDSGGNVWAADVGFSGGETIERPDLNIANTKEPGIYRAERYSMESFSWPLADGKYLVKLHFAETYEGITGPGQRVFSFNVQGHETKDFDVWVKAGGPFKAFVESVPVNITDGKLRITFTPNIENPQINGIEIIPQS